MGGGKIVKAKKALMYLVLLIFSAALILITSSAYNFEYVNVSLTVNITNAIPQIDALWVDQNILLNGGTTKIINCNMTITDWGGYNTLVGVNATLWDANSTLINASDDPNNHYTNTSCSESGNDGQYVANWTCSFAVWYYANPTANWTCNATVIDDANFTDNGQNTTSIQTFYAINVTPVIDYGDLPSATISNNITANITNIGNGRINVSVYGYGGFDPVIGAGYSMICEAGNITLDNERYSTNATATWAAKTILTGTQTNLSDISIPKRTASPTWNLTYWQLYIDPVNIPSGICNGTVVFTAEIG